jgi:hypothetical protein
MIGGATYLDAAPYAQHLEGKTWEQLDRSYIITRADALGFLRTRELVAVLPVYLRALLEDGAWSPCADTLVLLLTKPEPGKKTGIKLPRFEALVSALTSRSAPRSPRCCARLWPRTRKDRPANVRAPHSSATGTHTCSAGRNRRTRAVS